MSVKSDFGREWERAEILWRGLEGRSLFLAGGTGFFGKWILSFLKEGLARGFRYEVCVLSRLPKKFMEQNPGLLHPQISWLHGSIEDFSLQGNRFDYMLHGAQSADWRDYQQPGALARIERGTQNFLTQAEIAQCKNLHFMSSGAVYGTQISRLQKECGPFEDSSDVYVLGKRQGEKAFLALAAKSGAIATISRSYSFLGPHLPMDLHYAAGNFLGAILRGEQIIIRGNGTPLRSYLYPSDLVIWLITILLQATRSGAYNVGSDEPISIRQLAELFCEVGDEHGLRPSGIVVEQKQIAAGEPSRYVPSIEKAKDELGLRVWTDLRAAISRTFEFYRGNKEIG